VQLSIDETRPAAFHHELGVRLRALRDEGILVMGSGDVVHNLHAYAWVVTAGTLRLALRFEHGTRAARSGRPRLAGGLWRLGKDALLSVPTPEHYLPLLYVLGASFPASRSRSRWKDGWRFGLDAGVRFG